MSNVRVFVERTVQVQLQHFTCFQTPIPIFAALVVFSSLPIISRPSSRSISALAASLGKAITKLRTPKGIPLLTFLFDNFSRALNTAYLRVRIHIKIPIQWRHMFTRGPGRTRCDDDTYYLNPRAEAKYWRVAGRYRRRLYSASTTSEPREDSGTPLVPYYTPRLLPPYRDRASRDADTDAQEPRVSPRTFCKWHRMVFRDVPCHPTFAQAAVQIKYYSIRDLREIKRIARLLPDEQVFGERARKGKGWIKYSEMWQRWLDIKGMDLVIVFE